MKLCILGTSHAPGIFRDAAELKEIPLTDTITEASVVHVAQDSPVNSDGSRDLTKIDNLTTYALRMTECPVILSSQVHPGFTRSFGSPRLYHMAETLRIKDAMERAMHPEQFVIGCPDPSQPLPWEIVEYLLKFGAPIWKMTYEEAEFSKIAINTFLAAQVDCTNRLHEVAMQWKMDWSQIERVLKRDRRIGRWAYLTPGRWQDSKHILRDMHWLKHQ